MSATFLFYSYLELVPTRSKKRGSFGRLRIRSLRKTGVGSSPKSFIGNPDQLYSFVFQSDKIVIFTPLIYMKGLFFIIFSYFFHSYPLTFIKCGLSLLEKEGIDSLNFKCLLQSFFMDSIFVNLNNYLGREVKCAFNCRYMIDK